MACSNMYPVHVCTGASLMRMACAWHVHGMHAQAVDPLDGRHARGAAPRGGARARLLGGGGADGGAQLGRRVQRELAPVLPRVEDLRVSTTIGCGDPLHVEFGALQYHTCVALAGRVTQHDHSAVAQDLCPSASSSRMNDLDGSGGLCFSRRFILGFGSPPP